MKWGTIIKLGLCLTFIGGSSYYANDMMRISFDRLFPTSPFNDVLISCMQVRNSVTMLQNYSGSQEDYQMLIDLIVGRIVRISDAVQQVLKQSSIHQDDIAYLRSVIQYMSNEVTIAFKQKSYDRMHYIRQLMVSITSMLDKRL